MGHTQKHIKVKGGLVGEKGSRGRGKRGERKMGHLEMAKNHSTSIENNQIYF